MRNVNFWTGFIVGTVVAMLGLVIGRVILGSNRPITIYTCLAIVGPLIALVYILRIIRR